MSIEAMKQALEALENVHIEYDFHGNPADEENKMIAPAITALRQAIEQAEKQEPVIGTKTWFEDGKVVTQHLHPSDIYTRPVVHAVRCTYPQCQATNGCVGVCSKTAPVHASDISQERVDETAKDRHEWIGLTDEEIYDYADKFLYQHGSNYGIKSFGKAVEAKLKEKNSG
jgi:hypothetical protein